MNHAQRRALWSADTISVCEVSILQPTRFREAVKRLMEDVPELHFYHADVGLPQRYFYDRGLFPICRCEIEITADAVVRAIASSESPWETDYRLPPLRIMEFLLEGASPNPNHGGVVQLAVRVEGEERVLNGDDPAEFLQTVDALLQQHDPDIFLTDWGDSYILPRLLRMSVQMRVPLRLNRDPAHAVGRLAPRSYMSYGRVLAHGGERTLYGRLHLDRRNSFALAETGLA